MTEDQYKAMERRIDDVALRCARVEALLRMVSPDLWQVALELDSLGYLSTQSNTATATARPMVAKLWELQHCDDTGMLRFRRSYGEGRSLILTARMRPTPSLPDDEALTATAGEVVWEGTVGNPLGAAYPGILSAQASSLLKLLKRVEQTLDLS